MRTFRKVVIHGIEYDDITLAASDLNIDPAILIKELYRKSGDRWYLHNDDHFADDPNYLKEPAKSKPAEPHKETHVPGGPPTGGPGISAYELARRRRIYFTKVQPFQTDEEKPAK